MQEANPQRKPKPRINAKRKSYSLNQSGLYNISTKKRLEERLHQSVKRLDRLTDDSNYRVFNIPKSNGNVREIQAPKLELDIVQTRIASLLVRITMPTFVHSGVKGKSNVTNARVHVGDHPVLTLDIKHFYEAVSKKSIFHLFHHTMKSPPDVAGILADLCSYEGHIPTGSRLSMLLAFWCNHRMFSRLQMLCEVHDVTMTVYVDDLTFSGLEVNRLFQKKAIKIISEAGLTVHPDKTRLYRRNEPKLITGVIVNEEGVKVRNKHHKEMFLLFNKLETAETDEELESLQKEMLGRLNAAGQVDEKFKQRAKSFTGSRQEV